MKIIIVLAALAAGLSGCGTLGVPATSCAIGSPCAGCLMCIN